MFGWGGNRQNRSPEKPLSGNSQLARQGRSQTHRSLPPEARSQPDCTEILGEEFPPAIRQSESWSQNSNKDAKIWAGGGGRGGGAGGRVDRFQGGR